jgi:hypothetical protein
MKVINSSKFHYVGKEDGMYVFESNHKHVFDREVVKVYQAKLLHPDGSCVYFNVECTDSSKIAQSRDKRMAQVMATVSQTAEQRVCLTQSHRPTHTPKRSVAGNEIPVRIKKVNRKKRVGAMC